MSYLSNEADWPDRSRIAAVFAASDGWAAEMTPTLEFGEEFEWYGVQWEVVQHFKFPCCGGRVSLIRRAGGDLRSWTGVGPCPRECSEDTFTVEVGGSDDD